MYSKVTVASDVISQQDGSRLFVWSLHLLSVPVWASGTISQNIQIKLNMV